MSTSEWITTAQTVLLLIVAAQMKVFKGGQYWQKKEDSQENLKARIESLEDRFKLAGKEMSRLATEVQGLPERLRDDFYPKEVVDAWRDSSERERKWLIDQVQLLWNELRRIISLRKTP